MKNLILIISILFSSFYVHGGHEAGGEITYKQVYPDSSIYEVKLVLFRYCQGISLGSSRDIELGCRNSSASTTLTLNRISIEDVTSTKFDGPGPCTPANTFGAGAGIERHIYTAQIDFASTTYSSYANCTEAIFYAAIGIRSSTINTGLANTILYLESSIFFGNFDHNSNSHFEEIPLTTVSSNLAVRYQNHRRNPDADSLSYALKAPMTSSTTTATFGFGYGPDRFLSIYYPGILSYPYTNASANPPIGLTIDPKNGDLYFTPTVAGESTSYRIETTEWRADTNGVMQKAGITNYEFPLITGAYSLTLPELVNVPSEITVCNDEDGSLAIQAKLDVYIPPPPAVPASQADSLSFYMVTDYPVSLIIDSSVVGNPSQVYARLEWDIDSFTNIPDEFDIIVRAYNTESNQNYNYGGQRITVKLSEPTGTTTSVSNIGCGRGRISANIDSLNGIPAFVTTQVFDITNSLIHTGSVSNTSDDIFQVSSPGTYSVVTTAFFNPGCDSVMTHNVTFQASEFYPLPVVDTVLICAGAPATLTIPGKWEKGVWSTGDTAHSINVNVAGNYIVDLYDSCGTIYNHTFTAVERNYNPMVQDTTVCPSTPVTWTINLPNKIGATWPDLNTGNTFTSSTEDTFVLTIYDSLCFTSLQDSFTLTHLPIPQSSITTTNLISCNGEMIPLAASFDSSYTYVWSNGSTASTSSTNLSGYHWVDVSNNCATIRDSVFVSTSNSPVVQLASDPVICQGGAFTLSMNTETGVSYSWENGDSIIPRTVQNEQEYILTGTNICGSMSDSIYVYVIDVPSVNLGSDVVKNASDLITLKNLTPTRFTSKLWSIGSNADSIQVRLEGVYWLKENNQCGTDSNSVNVRFAGIEDLAELGITLFPNPVEDMLGIQNASGKSLRFELYDAQGRLVDEADLSGRSAQRQLSHLSPGLYTVKLMIGEKEVSAKLIKR